MVWVSLRGLTMQGIKSDSDLEGKEDEERNIEKENEFTRDL